MFDALEVGAFGRIGRTLRLPFVATGESMVGRAERGPQVRLEPGLDDIHYHGQCNDNIYPSSLYSRGLSPYGKSELECLATSDSKQVENAGHGQYYH